MKRSEIDRALRGMEKMIDRCSFKPPPFCYFTPEEWNEKGHEYDETRDNMLGWDITDFRMGDSDRVRFPLITLRDGNVSMDKCTGPYTEKLLYMKGGQSATMHFYWNKMENIVNRGRGSILIGVYNAGREGLADTDMRVHSDGREHTVPVGTQIRSCSGESITIQPYLCHDFHLEPGTGPVLLGRVSMRDNDNRGSRFYLPAGRSPVMGENKPSFCLLRSEYPPADSCARR